MVFNKNGGTLLLAGLLFFYTSCKTAYQPGRAEYADYPITAAQPRDTAIQRALQPYRDSVDRSMNSVVGTAAITLERKQPEGTLNNFMADAMFYAGQQQFKIPIDGAVVNHGGIRITQLAAGPVTRGKVFELMPFDNLLVVQKLKGSVLQQFLDHTAALGGWPLSGITMEIRDKKAVNVRIGGAPLDPEKTYTLVNSDYVANGGDNASMLKAVPQRSTGYLMRDAIFDYIRHLQAQGKPISAQLENRVTNAQ